MAARERKKILVVDDDIHMLGSISEVLRRKEFEVDAYSSGNEALAHFTKGTYSLVISDVRMPGMSGIELLDRIQSMEAGIPFIVMTAFGEIPMVVDAMRKGAYDLLEKNLELLDKLEFSVERALNHFRIVSENRNLKKQLEKRWEYIGQTQAMQSIRGLVDSIAQSKSTVLVSGESGTGKELIARSIHNNSKRQQGPFIKINCAALPEGLIESELFGHEKGAFTGAIRAKLGKFEQATGGTLLLDEIGEMPPSLQAKLLRVLQEGEISRVGGDDPVTVDVRVVATTNRDLEQRIRNNEFREDLYYRLNVFHIHLPPLCQRGEDIELLVEHFIQKYNEENGYQVTGVTPQALFSLRSHNWPGNIRELENAIERAVVLTKAGVISHELFDFKSNSISKQDALAPGMPISEAEQKLIMNTLEFCGQNRTKAAEMLGISIRTLRNKLHEYGVMQ